MISAHDWILPGQNFPRQKPGGKIIQALAGIGRLDFLGFSSIDLTLSLDFQGVGKA